MSRRLSKLDRLMNLADFNVLPANAPDFGLGAGFALSEHRIEHDLARIRQIADHQVVLHPSPHHRILDHVGAVGATASAQDDPLGCAQSWGANDVMPTATRSGFGCPRQSTIAK